MPSDIKSECRALLGVWPALQDQLADLIGSVSGLPLSHLPLQGVSCIAEIILVMRYVELRAHLHRVLAVLKVRDSIIDPAFHRFTITGAGIEIEEDAAGAEEILSEAAQQTHFRGLSRTPRVRGTGSN